MTGLRMGGTSATQLHPSPKSGGVLIGLRQDTFSKELIRWQEIVPGRLLHVRAFALQQHVDLITIYQHALPFNGELLEDVMKRRNSLLKLLDTHVGSLPARSSVVIGGDLNCVLEPSPPHVGHGVHRGADRPHLTEERQWIGAMLRRHGLCALKLLATEALHLPSTRMGNHRSTI